MESVKTTAKLTHAALAALPLGDVRRALRGNAYAGHTAGLCSGKLQCNLVILPADQGRDFQKYCEANPVFCPLLGVAQPGQTRFDNLGTDMDLRRDLPLYFIYRPGQPVAQAQDIAALWRDDFMSFAIGCSFTFEHALMRAGFAMRHVEQGVTVPMYRSNIATTPVGDFGGPAVVSMRPIPKETAHQVKDICAAFPHAHGAPIHIGDPAAIGITDINAPEWGAPVTLREGEVPAFWGCGVTSQVALSTAAPQIAITHAPGAMLIADADEAAPPNWQQY
ncbi:MAG: putative hydro-lyase [Sulfitobacter sp.]